MGKGATGLCSPQRKHEPDTKGWNTRANLTAGNSKQGGKSQGASIPQSLRTAQRRNLQWCWQFLRKDAAPGIDKVDYREYEAELDSNIGDLVERLKGKRYRARLVRRQYIPKLNGKLRPLGIPTTEDKLLQRAVAKILEAIYEEDFLSCSYGYRPKCGPQDAVRDLTRELQFGRYHWVVEADIKGFFDNIDHDWMIRMLEERIDDQPFLHLIRKWLKAGVLETDGQVVHPVTGTPQGGVVSPVLANTYLHYALDLWFELCFKPSCQGSAVIIRFADDFVCAFENQEDAERFYAQIGVRLGKFGLEVAPDKLESSVSVVLICPAAGPSSFSVLSFGGAGTAKAVGGTRRTSPKNFKASVATFTAWIKEARRKVRRPV